MKNFRSHIIKAYSFGFILVGFLLHFVNPIQDTGAHSEFTTWLDAKVKSEENVSVRSLIEELADDGVELNEVIRKASEIVSKNSDDFELPVSEDTNALDVIIQEWNAYQTASSGMGKAVIIENAKSNAISQKETSPLKKPVKAVSESCLKNPIKIETNWDILTGQKSHSYTPFLSGVAINAP